MGHLSSHADAPACELKYPFAHASQASKPLAAVKRPGLHFAQPLCEVTPVALLKVPTAHVPLHIDALVRVPDSCRPAAQGSHCERPVPLTPRVPGGQDTQLPMSMLPPFVLSRHSVPAAQSIAATGHIAAASSSSVVQQQRRSIPSTGVAHASGVK